MKVGSDQRFRRPRVENEIEQVSALRDVPLDFSVPVALEQSQPSSAICARFLGTVDPRHAAPIGPPIEVAGFCQFEK